MSTNVQGFDGATDGRVPREAPGRSPLSMSRAEMRRTGYAVVDLLVDWVDQPDPVIQRASPDQMATLLHTSCPQTALGVDEVLAEVLRCAYRLGCEPSSSVSPARR